MFVPDRQYIPQYAQDFLSFAVSSGGALVDPDSNTVMVTCTNTDTEQVIFSRAAVRAGAGQYQVNLTTPETSVPGNYTARAQYTIGGAPEAYEGLFQIGKAAPPYDALTAEMKSIVESVCARFGDLFDSPLGGPNLETYFQSKFDRGRIAQLMRMAVGRLNTVSQPFQTYSIDGDGGGVFPVAQWGALLERATYVEVIKHLRRSYVEQPQFMGGEVTRLDRRDYLDRWGEILQDEEEDLKGQLESFKISNMGLGRPSVLVSGGVYGRWAPTRLVGSAAARGIFFSRGFIY